jgi:hypothetical protein
MAWRRGNRSPPTSTFRLELAEHLAETGSMRRASRCGSAVTVALYAGCLLLIAAGPGNSLVGAIGVIGWVGTMGLAFVNLALGGVALSLEGRCSGSCGRCPRGARCRARGQCPSAVCHAKPELTLVERDPATLVIRSMGADN